MPIEESSHQLTRTEGESILKAQLSKLRLGKRYWVGLWWLLAGLLLFIAFLLVWLLLSYQARAEQQRVENAAETLVTAISRVLTVNLQGIQVVARPSRDNAVWPQAAADLLKSTKAILRIERRDINFALQEARDNPYAPALFKVVPRDQSQQEAIQACSKASGPGLPVYSTSYFTPLGRGLGIEVIDLCAAQQIDGKTVGYTVETLGLSSVLESSMTEEMNEEFEASFIEGVSTRIARAGASPGLSTFKAERTLVVAGLTLRLKLDSIRESAKFKFDFTTNVTLMSILLGMTLISVVIFQGRRRAKDAALARRQQDRMQDDARLATVGEVASFIAHEINQPLMSILAYAKAAQNVAEANHQRLPPSFHEILNLMSEEGKRCSRIVKGVRDFVSRESVQREAVAASELIEGVRPILDLLARDYGARILENSVPNSTLLIVCDRIMVEQVILNLARNAFQAMVASELRCLKITARSDGSDKVKFSVADTGPGLSEKILQRLSDVNFKSFERVKAEGLGLGLSLCRSVVQSHKGTFVGHNRLTTATSSKRVDGAIFSFTLPCLPRDQRQAAALSSQIP